MMSDERDATERRCRYTPSHIANYFIWLSRRQGVNDLTPMKLIKLVYIGYAWYFSIKEEPLFDEVIEAWEHGPVIPSLYAEFKNFKKNPVDKYSTYGELDDDNEVAKITYPIIERNDREVNAIMAAVFKFYKGKTGAQLSDITHGDMGAWKCARKKAEESGKPALMDIGDSDIAQKIREGAKKGIDKFLKS